MLGSPNTEGSFAGLMGPDTNRDRLRDGSKKKRHRALAQMGGGSVLHTILKNQAPGRAGSPSMPLAPSAVPTGPRSHSALRMLTRCGALGLCATRAPLVLGPTRAAWSPRALIVPYIVSVRGEGTPVEFSVFSPNRTIAPQVARPFSRRLTARPARDGPPRSQGGRVRRNRFGKPLRRRDS